VSFVRQGNSLGKQGWLICLQDSRSALRPDNDPGTRARFLLTHFPIRVDALKTVVAPASAQRGLHTGQQFFLGKGLYQIVIGEHTQTLDLRDF
jgi:hypothetical protein